MTFCGNKHYGRSFNLAPRIKGSTCDTHAHGRPMVCCSKGIVLRKLAFSLSLFLLDVHNWQRVLYLSSPWTWCSQRYSFPSSSCLPTLQLPLNRLSQSASHPVAIECTRSHAAMDIKSHKSLKSSSSDLIDIYSSCAKLLLFSSLLISLLLSGPAVYFIQEDDNNKMHAYCSLEELNCILPLEREREKERDWKLTKWSFFSRFPIFSSLASNSRSCCSTAAAEYQSPGHN